MREPNVWIEISGPAAEEAARSTTPATTSPGSAERFIFGTDWPGVPGIRANAQAVVDLGFGREVLETVFYRNALAVYGLELPS